MISANYCTWIQSSVTFWNPYPVFILCRTDLPGGYDAFPAAELYSCVPCYQWNLLWPELEPDACSWLFWTISSPITTECTSQAFLQETRMLASLPYFTRCGQLVCVDMKTKCTFLMHIPAHIVFASPFLLGSHYQEFFLFSAFTLWSLWKLISTTEEKHHALDNHN